MKHATERQSESSKLRALIENSSRDVYPEGCEKGFLSLEYGFQPPDPPLQSFPASHRAWDELIHEVPSLLADGKVLSRLAELETLPADAEALPQKYLNRAALVLAKLNHIAARAAEQNERVRPGAGSAAFLLPSLRAPWERVTQRLGRPRPMLAFRDLYLYNWRLQESHKPRTRDNLTLLCPIYDSATEHNFYLPTIQMHHDAAPLLQAAIDIEEAMAEHDFPRIENALSSIFHVLHHLTFNLLLAIDPNPYSKSYVDHLVWAKTVGPFAAPAYPDEIGVSGGGSPIFLLLDALTGRAENRTLLGQAAVEMTREMPRADRLLFQRARELQLNTFLQEYAPRALKTLWQEVIDAYAGDRGWLGVHQLKVYGYMELGFKSGRTQTNGGFKSDVEARSWEDIDEELSLARQERWREKKLQCPFARRARTAGPERDSGQSGDTGLLPNSEKDTRANLFLSSGEVDELPAAATAGTTNSNAHSKVIRLALEDAPVHVEAGDRIGVRARNGDEIVERCLQRLKAHGEEKISLSKKWKAYFTYIGHPTPSRVSMREFLTHAHLRPLLRSSAKALYSFCGDTILRDVIESRAEDQWELPDALQHVGARADVQRLWQSEPWQREHISHWLPPQHMRIYSVASKLKEQEGRAYVELHVGPLQYRDSSETSTLRNGAASSFLHSHAAAARPFPASWVRPSKFRLPDDPSRPIVMMAGGTGIAPFRSFWQVRTQKSVAPDLLLWGARHWKDLPFLDELQNEVKNNRLDVHIALSGAKAGLRTFVHGADRRLASQETARHRIEHFMREDELAEDIWRKLMTRDEGGEEAHFYLCGRTSFANSVLSALQGVIARHTGCTPDSPTVRERIRRLVGEGRLHLEIFTTYAPASAAGVQGNQTLTNSELTRHHDLQNGQWMVVQGNVYDVSEFQHLHPGGAQIIRANAGIDATRSYEATQHHLNPEVHAMLDLYKVGAIQRIDFGTEWGIAFLPQTSEDRLASARVKKKNIFYVTLEDLYKHWVRYLFRITEVKNTVENNFSLGEKPLFGPDLPSQDTHLHQQLVLESVLLFATDSLPALLEKRFEKLWLFTVGLCGKDVQPLPLLEQVATAVDELKRMPMQRTVRRLAALIDERSEEASPLLRKMHALNQTLIDTIQQVVRQGASCFEKYGIDTCHAAGRHLVKALQDVIAKIHEYQSAFGRLEQRVSPPIQFRSSPVTSISILGAGVQGTAVARMMLKDDFDVHVYDVDPHQTVESVEYGALAVADLRAALAASPVVLVIVNAGDAQEKLLCDPAVIGALGTHHTVVQMGNASVEGTLRSADAVKRSGARFVEAVLMGPSGLVLAGECPIAYGGEAKDFGEIATLLDGIGPIFSAGDVGQAAAFNLAALSAIYGLTHGFSVATAMMEEAGLDLETWLSFTKASVIGNAAGFLADFVFPAHLQDRTYDLVGSCKVKNAGAAAETDLLVEQARRLHVTSEFIEVMRKAHHEASRKNPGADWTSVYEGLRPAVRTSGEN